MSSSIEYQLMGAKNGNEDNTVKGKDVVAAVHLNTFCIYNHFWFFSFWCGTRRPLGKSSKYGCHTFVIFGRWQQPVNDGITNTYSNNLHSCSSNLLLTTGNSSGKGLDEDDNAIIAVLLAQEVLMFEKFLEKPVGDDANGPGRRYRKVFSRPNYKESVCWCSLIPYYMYIHITFIYIRMLYGIQVSLRDKFSM